MTAKRLTITLTVSLTALLIGMAVGTYIISGVLQSQAQELSMKRGEIEQLSDQERSIASSKRDIAAYSSLESITKAIVPQDKNQAATVREILNIANASKVSLTTITFPSSTLGNERPAKSTSAAAGAAAAAKPNLSQLTPVKGLPGVYNLQITLANNTTNTVTYNQLTNFLRGLENNRRTAAVASINIQPQISNPNALVFSLIINTYIKP